MAEKLLAPFVGRRDELDDLKLLLKKKTSSLVVIKGRRRVGKSRLIREFTKKFPHYRFTGVAPTKQTTAKSQRDIFARQLAQQTSLPEVFADDWTKLFLLLADKLRTGRIILVFDELSWMGSKDPDFLGLLKEAWDSHFKENPKLIMILCSSASAWIEENILSNTGFMGRLSATLPLEELSMSLSNKLLKALGCQYSPYDTFKLLSITGGIPRYLEEINPSNNVDENLRRLCFTRGGILFREFDDIFTDLFDAGKATYKRIVEILSDGPLSFDQICHELKLSKGGYISTCLNKLILSGFIKRDYTWAINSAKESTLSVYRLSDNYCRFYLKYIEPNKRKIEQGHFLVRSITSLPAWDTITGLQFENLILNNRDYIIHKLHLKFDEIIADNPFFQKPNRQQAGCQIDYLIQTRFKVLYICEVKYSRQPISQKVIAEVQEKITRLKRRGNFTCLPVLIHVNGVTQSVIDDGFFAEIIDMSELLDETH